MTKCKKKHGYELHSSALRSVFCKGEGGGSNVVNGRSVLSMRVQEMHLLYQLFKLGGALSKIQKRMKIGE